MQKEKKIYQRIVLLILSVLFALACVGSNVGTPTVVPTFTSTPCLEVPYTPAAESGKPTFYFVLVDGTLNYDLQKIDDARNVLERALSAILQTGDRVIVGWINDPAQYYGIENSIFFNDVFVIEAGDVPLLPTLPPTLGAFSTATVTPTSLGQLRQTEIARTVDAAKEQEQEFIQKTINDYFCQKGEAVTEIEEIHGLVEKLRHDSIDLFVKQLKSQFPSPGEYEASENNPFFEILAETADFIAAECSLNTYSNCMLVIFSDLKDFRQNFPSNEIPYSDMRERIDVIPVFFECQFATACEKKTEKWNEHFSYFHSRNFEFILNTDADKENYNERISNDLIDRILRLKSNR